MAAPNNNPVYSYAGVIQWGATALTAANTAVDGTGTVLTVFTGDATNGGWVEKLIARAAGTNIATVLRVFINNGSTQATPANNILIAEMTLPATTSSLVAAQPAYELPLGFMLPPGYVINVVIATAVSAGYYVSVQGGKY